MAKKLTIDTLAAQMQKGFASVEAKIEKISARMERGFAVLRLTAQGISHEYHVLPPTWSKSPDKNGP